MSDPIYRLPPDEMKPELMFLAEELGESRDWGHAPLFLSECQKLSMGEGIRVAILDTGCDMSHPDLADRVEVSKDFTGSRTGASDVAGHGSHCAGVVAANANGGGIIGTAPAARLLIGKVLGDNGSGSSSGIAAGIRWAAEQGANIISMSLGGPVSDSGTAQAVREVTARGIFVIAAAGNEGPREGTVGYPGGYDESVCVGAVGTDLKPASFSSRGAQLDVAAPGVSVRSCYPGGRYATYSGTSMATPYVAGCIALFLAYLKKLGQRWPTPAELFRLIQRTSKDLDIPGMDTATGWGLIQPLALMRLVQPPAPVPPTPVPPAPVPPGVPALLIAYDALGRELARYKP